jgi:hypothetical protein
MRLIGDQDTTYSISIPTSATYYNSKTGVRTFVVYNPQATTQSGTIYQNGVATGTMTVPGYAYVNTTNPNYVPTAPPTPTGVTAAASVGAVALNWNPATSATSYNVKRSGTSGGPYAIIASPTGAGYTDTSVGSGGIYYYVVSGSNTIGESANSTEVSGTVPVSPVIAINCGGSAAIPFVADTDYSAGTTSTTTNAINTGSVANPAPQAVYQSNRYGNVTYTVGGLTPGASYIVRLHFCENYWTASGKRTFNVSINGSQVLSAFDIYGAAGGEYVANVQQFTKTTNSTGQFVIQFTTVKDNAQVNGIEIRIPPPVISTVDGTQTVNAGQSVTFAITATGSGSLTYQWYKNGVAIQGATNPSYTISSPSGSDAGTYSVNVTDSTGDVTTSSYTLTVTNSIPAMPPLALAAMGLLLALMAGRRLLARR